MTDFGTDLSCTTDLTESMLEATGITVLVEGLIRRVTTPTGGLIDDPGYGFDITALVDDGLDDRAVGRIAARLDHEFTKDERVYSSSTDASFTAGVLTLSTIIVTAGGPFRLVLAVTDVSVTVLKVVPA